MGYTAFEPVINPAFVGDTTLNLTAWKAHMQEIHDWIISAGFLQTDDSGQLDDFDSVTTLPVEGAPDTLYRVYEVDDILSDQGYRIVFRLDFGTWSEGLSATIRLSPSPSIKVTFGTTTNGAGVVLSHDNTSTHSPEVSYRCPQGAVPGGAILIPSTVSSSKYACYNPERGFYGLVFALNGRGGVVANDLRPAYNGNSLLLVIQRTLDAAGTPTPTGFCVYTHNLNAAWGTTSRRWPSHSQLLDVQKTRSIALFYDSRATVSSLNVNLKQGMQAITPDTGIIQVSPCYIIGRSLSYNPNMVTYRSLDLAPGTQFEVETSPGIMTNFIALGPGTSMFPDTDGQNSSYALLFE